MDLLRVTTPCRLHFGLLAWGPSVPRTFGGVGLMIDQPGVQMECRPNAEWSAIGPLSHRVLEFAHRVVELLEQTGVSIEPRLLTVQNTAPEHIGLGTGTQLGLAVAVLISESAGLRATDSATLAKLSGRGLRSGIGLHGFLKGGLIVDGGHGASVGPPPLVAQAEFPADWRVLIVRPDLADGLHGPDESRAFARLPNVPEPLTDRLCRLVLLGLLPAVAERDLKSFGAALTEMQEHVGLVFSSVQGGVYAGSRSEEIIAALRDLGLEGVGQSSWGPILYGFIEHDDDRQTYVLSELNRRFGLGPADSIWTVANSGGAILGRRSGDA